MSINKIKFRSGVSLNDLQQVKEIVSSSGYFNNEEIDIALELVEERLSKGEASGYHFIFADAEQTTVAYSCFGPIPATKYSYDLYWIAVHESMRGQGIGKILLKESERRIKDMGGQRIYIETSGQEKYISTRKFYIRNGYQEAAVLSDFYAPGDAKYIYVKEI